MPSRVLSGAKTQTAEPVRWLPAFGAAVNTPISREEAPEPHENLDSQELEAATHRIQILERRIQELEAELPRRHQLGHQEGRAAGEAAGAASASAALRPLLERLGNTIADLATYRARFRRDAEPELLRLALAIARKVLRRELTVDPHSLLGILKAALESINRAEVLSVRAAPDDAQYLIGHLAGLGLPDSVDVIPDRTLERGSVILETKRGQIDASISTQLTEIENGFADRIATQSAK